MEAGGAGPGKKWEGGWRDGVAGMRAVDGLLAGVGGRFPEETDAPGVGVGG